jgi:hypothetical protein
MHTGYRHDHCRWGTQIGERHREGCHCDEGVVMHCDRASSHNEVPRLHLRVQVSRFSDLECTMRKIMKENLQDDCIPSYPVPFSFS